MMAALTRHVPILTKEILRYLNCRPNGIYIDATLGGGGHTRMLLEASTPHGVVIGIDRDAHALNIARESLEGFHERLTLIHGNFKDLKQICHNLNIQEADGILMDLGMSSDQLEQTHRGFSFKYPDDPLDMRMDETIPQTAADILNGAPEETLREILLTYGEERWAAAIAREITTLREITPFQKVGDLIEAIRRAIPSRARHRKRHMATKTFQALRIYVNDELHSLREGLRDSLSLLAPGGRLAVISFHSLEDRIAKRTFLEASRVPSAFEGKQYTLLTLRPLRPSPEETRRNPRARSAKLRVIERSPV